MLLTITHLPQRGGPSAPSCPCLPTKEKRRETWRRGGQAGAALTVPGVSRLRPKGQLPIGWGVVSVRGASDWHRCLALWGRRPPSSQSSAPPLPPNPAGPTPPWDQPPNPQNRVLPPTAWSLPLPTLNSHPHPQACPFKPPADPQSTCSLGLSHAMLSPPGGPSSRKPSLTPLGTQAALLAEVVSRLCRME